MLPALCCGTKGSLLGGAPVVDGSVAQVSSARRLLLVLGIALCAVAVLVGAAVLVRRRRLGAKGS